MADKAHELTDKKLEEMEKRLSAIFSTAKEEIEKTADEYFDRFTEADEKKRKLVDEGKISKKEYKEWCLNKIAYGDHYKQLKEQLAEELLHVNETAIAYINGELPEVYALNYNALAPEVDGIGGYSFELTDANTVKNLALTDKSLLPYKKVNAEKDIAWNMKKINSQVLQGILQGESIPKIAKRMLNVEKMNENAAVRTARTIVTGAENKGRQDSYERATSDGIVMKRKWVATHDNRTRDWHTELNGKTVDVDEPWVNSIGKIRFPADPMADGANVYNCRCTMAAKVMGFVKKTAEKVQETRKIIANNIEEAKRALVQKIGFKKIHSSALNNNNKTLIEATNRLNELEEKFGIIHKSSLYFSGENYESKTEAFVASSTTNPTFGYLSLCNVTHTKTPSAIAKSIKKEVAKKWIMPCDDEYLSVYTPTHEYGHIIQNFIVRKDFEKDGWKEAKNSEFIDNSSRSPNLRNKWYIRHREDTERRCFKEIQEIAEKNNPDFKMSDNISNYGKTCYSEFFAEAFANSQCGSPNELGKAMSIWLERNVLNGN